MAKRKRSVNEEIPPGAPPCSWEGCRAPGMHKAPRGRSQLHDYQWLCLDHVREFNAQWDYFKDMDSHAIERFMQDSLTGHRPTWRREDHVFTPEQLVAALNRFMHFHETRTQHAQTPRLKPKERKALETLGLETPLTLAALKKHYKILVKKHHPDLHRSDRAVEERFKEITAAYQYLIKEYG